MREGLGDDWGIEVGMLWMGLDVRECWVLWQEMREVDRGACMRNAQRFQGGYQQKGLVGGVVGGR